MLVAIRDYVLGPQRAHMQPNRRTARTAVIEEGDWPLFSLRVFLEVGHVEHSCERCLVFRFFGLCVGKLASRLGFSIHVQLGVLHISGSDSQGAGDSSVGDVLASYIDGTLGADLRGRRFLG